MTTPCIATTAEQLSLTPGQLILVLAKNSSGWWLGELQVSRINQRSIRGERDKDKVSRKGEICEQQSKGQEKGQKGNLHQILFKERLVSIWLLLKRTLEY